MDQVQHDEPKGNDDQQQDEYDSPWKVALRNLLPQFLAFFYPAVHAAVDWRKEPVFLDKELQKLAPKALLGKRTVDTLVRVWTQSGKAQWLQIHIEVQSQVDPHFAERMFVYAYRIYDRYHQLPVSMAVLGDDSPNWRPEQYIARNATSALSLHFGMVKLLDYQARWEELVNDSNPFALVVLAHLEAMRTDQNSLERVDAKTELMRLLGLRKYSEQETEDLLRFVDWLLQLSTAMEPLFEARIAEMKGSEPMTYISTLERKAHTEGQQVGQQIGQQIGHQIGHQVGLQEGLEKGSRKGLLAGIGVGLKLKFGDDGLALLPVIQQIADPEVLEILLNTLAECASLAEFQDAIPHA